MPRGHYIIDDTKSNARADTSFRACILTLLAFLLLCGTVMLILWLTMKGSVRSGGDHISSDYLSGEESSSTMAPSVSEEHRGASEKTTTPESVDKDVKNLPRPPPVTLPPTSSSPPSSSPSSSLSPPPPPFPSHEDTLPERVPEPPTPPPKIRVPCEEVECKKLASSILHTMGHGEDPCKQFYQYACGGLQSNKYLFEPDYPNEAFMKIYEQVNIINDKDPKSLRKFKGLLESCNNYDPDKNIQQWKNAVLEEMTYIGNISKNADDFLPDFTHIFLGLLQHDRPIIFEITLDVYDKHPNTFLIKILAANLIRDKMILDDTAEMEDCYSKVYKPTDYLKFLYKKIKQCLNDKERRKMMKAAEEALRLLDIFSPDEELKLNETLTSYEIFLNDTFSASANIAYLREQLQDRSERRFQTIREINDILFDFEVNWTHLIGKLINREVKDDEKIQFYSEKYFKYFLPDTIERKRDLHNALLVAFVAERYRSFVEAQQHWRRVVQPLLCTRLAALLLPDVASALYVRSFNDLEMNHLQRNVSDTLFSVARTYEEEFERADWIYRNETLYNGLYHKVNQLSVNISGDSNIRNYTQLDKDLEKYTINETDFVQNAVILMKRNRERLYDRINKDPMKCIWSHFLSPYDTDAMSIIGLKVIAIPLGALQKPFFQHNYLPHITMAGLGFVLAHEVAHHLDAYGIQFDTSNVTQDLKIYRDGLPTFPKTESGTEYKSLLDTDYNDIRKLKYNETFADRLGVKIAYKTFNKTDKEDKDNKFPDTLPFLTLNNDQTFFVFLAQKYCTKLQITNFIDFFEGLQSPSDIRVEQMTNINEFHEVFSCSKTSNEFPFYPYSESDHFDDGPPSS